MTQTMGISAQQPDEARYEAAKKLITNHRRVLLDITNPEPKTQTELARLPAFDRPQVRKLPSYVTKADLISTTILTKATLTNHRRVLLDITNPDPKTQTELARLPAFDRPQVTDCLCPSQKQTLGPNSLKLNSPTTGACCSTLPTGAEDADGAGTAASVRSAAGEETAFLCHNNKTHYN
jgi:hypothetical protein